MNKVTLFTGLCKLPKIHWLQSYFNYFIFDNLSYRMTLNSTQVIKQMDVLVSFHSCFLFLVDTICLLSSWDFWVAGK